MTLPSNLIFDRMRRKRRRLIEEAQRLLGRLEREGFGRNHPSRLETVVEIILLQELPFTHLFYIETELAEAILEGKWPWENIDQFSRTPFDSMFIQFSRPIQIPDLVPKHPETSFHGVQIHKDTRAKVSNPYTLGIWYKNARYGGEPGATGFLEYETLSTMLPHHASRAQMPPQLQSLISLILKFIGFLSSHNVSYNRVPAETREPDPKKRKHNKTTPLYIPFLKYRQSTSTGSAGSRTLSCRFEVSGHYKDFYYCPQCDTNNSQERITSSGICKKCGQFTPGLGNWINKPRWSAKFLKGPSEAEIIYKRHFAEEIPENNPEG